MVSATKGRCMAEPAPKTQRQGHEGKDGDAAGHRDGPQPHSGRFDEVRFANLPGHVQLGEMEVGDLGHDADNHHQSDGGREIELASCDPQDMYTAGEVSNALALIETTIATRS